ARKVSNSALCSSCCMAASRFFAMGRVWAGAYGHTLGGAVGLGFVENEAGVSKEYVGNGRYQIEIASVRYPTQASLRPMYDSKNKRVRS
ncbi:MAG: glycine cleavage T C-terminal barrel domain-containing protein, partial [Anaerolineae bacterium]